MALAQARENSFTIYVKSLSGKVYELDAFSNQSTIKQIKEVMESKTAIEPAQQRLVFRGNSLVNENTLESSKITAGAQIHMIIAFRGGSDRR